MARAPGWTVLAIALMVCLALPLHARGDEGAIEIDRPDVSNGTKTVPPGALQVETGLEYGHSSVAGSAAEKRLALQTTLRAGLTERLEVALDGEPVVWLHGSGDETEPGDLTVGLKYRFLDAAEGKGWPSLGIQPFVKVPVADQPVGSERPDFGLLTLASFDLPRRFDLDVNLGLVAVGQSRPDGYLLQALASASLSREIGEGLSTFAEVFFASRAERGERDSLGLNAGIVHVLRRDLALDAAAGTSLAGGGPDYTVTAGVSVRFGR